MEGNRAAPSAEMEARQTFFLRGMAHGMLGRGPRGGGNTGGVLRAPEAEAKGD